MERFKIDETTDARLEESIIDKVIKREIDPKLSLTEAEKKAKDKISGVMGRLLSLGRGKKEIKVIKHELAYRPYWVMKGEYFCEYLKIKTYVIPVHDEVEEVFGKELNKPMRIVKSKAGLQDVLNGISVSAGGPSITLGTVASLFSAVKGKVSKSFELNVIERRERRNGDDGFCIDAHEDKKEGDALEIVKESKHKSKEITSEKQMKGQVLASHVTKSDAVKEFKSQLMKHPDEAERILKEFFNVDSIELVYIPEYHFDLESEEEKRRIIVNGISGDAEDIA